MQNKILLLTVTAALVCSCTPVRTVYDANGNEVKEREGATVSSLNSHFEKEFQSSFMERKGKNGVPQTSSNRVSSFQKDLDNSRKMNNEYLTKAYGAVRDNNSRTAIYAGASSSSRYSRDRDRREKDRKMAYGTDMRPDFMNSSHGISHSSRYGANSQSRSSADGSSASGISGRTYSTGRSGYSTEDTNSYVAGRRGKTPRPKITNFRDYYRQTIESTRSLLGRDNNNNNTNNSRNNNGN